MHEAALAEQILAIIGTESHGLSSVTAIYLRIGTLASVDSGALQFALECALTDSRFAGAVLHLDNEPAEGRCSICGSVFPMTTLYDPCPACGSFRHRMLAGTSMTVAAIEGCRG